MKFKLRAVCRVATKMVSEKLEKLKDKVPDDKQSLLEIYLRNPTLDFKDVVGMACDMLLAGIDTVSFDDLISSVNSYYRIFFFISDDLQLGFRSLSLVEKSRDTRQTQGRIVETYSR